MHIDGTVSVFAPPGNRIGDFTINKTFSWGGIYGASTTIKSVEAEFASNVFGSQKDLVTHPIPVAFPHKRHFRVPFRWRASG